MRFTNQKRNHPFKNIVISVIIFLSVTGLFNYGIQSMSKQSIDEQQTNLETAIERCVSQYYVHCWSLSRKFKCFRKRIRFNL